MLRNVDDAKNISMSDDDKDFDEWWMKFTLSVWLLGIIMWAMGVFFGTPTR